jgi:hypothetical protein
MRQGQRANSKEVENNIVLERGIHTNSWRVFKFESFTGIGPLYADAPGIPWSSHHKT